MNLYGVTITCNWIAISLWFLYALTQGTLGMKNEKITRLLLEMLELDSSDYVRLMVSNTATSVPLKSKCWSKHAFTGSMFLVRTIIVYYGVKLKSYFSWILWKVDFFKTWLHLRKLQISCWRSLIQRVHVSCFQVVRTFVTLNHTEKRVIRALKERERAEGALGRYS